MKQYKIALITSKQYNLIDLETTTKIKAAYHPPNSQHMRFLMSICKKLTPFHKKILLCHLSMQEGLGLGIKHHILNPKIIQINWQS